MNSPRRRRPYDRVKRLLDIVGASIGLILVSPLFVIEAALIAIRLGRPVFFSQSRPGLNSRIFRVRKFRTMKHIDPSRGLLTDEQRLGRLGRTLRATSLDELPTLFNVLVGEMSLVGPRPLLPEYLSRYSPQQARRHEVRPGVTGLAQVSGRNSISWEQKFALDVEYVDTYCLRVDATILWRTLRAVALRQGISSDGHATAREFLGSGGDEVST